MYNDKEPEIINEADSAVDHVATQVENLAFEPSFEYQSDQALFQSAQILKETVPTTFEEGLNLAYAWMSLNTSILERMHTDIETNAAAVKAKKSHGKKQRAKKN